MENIWPQNFDSVLEGSWGHKERLIFIKIWKFCVKWVFQWRSSERKDLIRIGKESDNFSGLVETAR